MLYFEKYKKENSSKIVLLFIILPFANTNVSSHILVRDTSIFAKGNMDRRE
jgi:hypothetical protein